MTRYVLELNEAAHEAALDGLRRVADGHRNAALRLSQQLEHERRAGRVKDPRPGALQVQRVLAVAADLEDVRAQLEAGGIATPREPDPRDPVVAALEAEQHGPPVRQLTIDDAAPTAADVTAQRAELIRRQPSAVASAFEDTPLRRLADERPPRPVPVNGQEPAEEAAHVRSDAEAWKEGLAAANEALEALNGVPSVEDRLDDDHVDVLTPE